MTETFESAVNALYSSDHQASTPEAIAQTAQRRTQTISDMRVYLQRIGLLSSLLNNTTSAFQNTRLIHITGTKGKGSTACLCETMLRRGALLRTGLFTSPHLVDIRERIRINGLPVSKQVFSKAYWTLRRRLETHADGGDLPVLPGYFRMLTLMALYIFSHYEPSIDVIILEVGMGGRYDATNCLDVNVWKSYACGITKLDYDHVRVLGHRLEQIAWEKAGIFLSNKLEPGSPRPPDNDNDNEPTTTTVTHKKTQQQHNATTTTKYKYFALDPHNDSVRQVIEQQSEEQVCFVTRKLSLDVPIGLAGHHQRDNAELALALCQAVCDEEDSSSTSIDMMHTALAHAKWLGRCQTILQWQSNVNIRLDGAHTVESVQVGLQWFEQETIGARRHLVFNCSHERNPVELLERFVPLQFHSVYFCRADSERPSAIRKPSAKELLLLSSHHCDDVADLPDTPETTWQETLCTVWRVLDKNATATATKSLSEALEQIRVDSNEETQEVLIAGSLYLVGSALSALSWKEDDADGSLKESK